MSDRAVVRDSEQMDELWVSNLGTVAYQRARELQARLAAARHADELPDLLLLLEHPAVYTRGRRSQAAELPMGEDWYRAQGIEICDTDRGGAVTYHGPGQLVAYPIVSLRPYGDDVHGYVRGLERVTIETLAALGIEAQVREGLTGVWVGERKIGSIGVHISRGVTTHGLAINVNNDLQPFEWIVPCGIEGVRMTSVGRELGAEQDPGRVENTLVGCFAGVFGRRPLPVDPARLAEHVEASPRRGEPAAAALR
jgi:lipoyl(octanoyl) transferase